MQRHQQKRTHFCRELKFSTCSHPGGTQAKTEKWGGGRRNVCLVPATPARLLCREIPTAALGGKNRERTEIWDLMSLAQGHTDISGRTEMRIRICQTPKRKLVPLTLSVELSQIN